MMLGCELPPCEVGLEPEAGQAHTANPRREIDAPGPVSLVVALSNSRSGAQLLPLTRRAGVE